MIFIPKKLRILPLSVAVITALSCSASVFSASYVTTTTYTGDSTVTVSSTISDVVAGEQVTFLVAKANPTLTEHFVYIDQAPATGTTATFKFTSTLTNMLGTETFVKFGTSSISSANITPNITPNGSSGVFNIPNPRTMSLSGTVLKSVLAPDIVNNKCNPLNSIVTFGTMTGGQTNDICGILFSASSSATTGIAREFTFAELNAQTISIGDGTVKKYAALGGKNASSGQFAIKLVDGGADILKPGTYYTRAYGVYDGTVTLGDVETVILPASINETLLD